MRAATPDMLPAWLRGTTPCKCGDFRLNIIECGFDVYNGELVVKCPYCRTWCPLLVPTDADESQDES